ncbi:hypothetical protein KX453_20115 [Escherichia coli]|nr:hypothetical protein [Escherichia coli]
MIQFYIIIAALAIYLGLHKKVFRVIIWFYYEYRIKMVFHYIEYSFHGERYHTRRSGPLNDLEGNGLICEIKKRGGKILYHKEGTFDYIDEVINFRQQAVKDHASKIINGSYKRKAG